MAALSKLDGIESLQAEVEAIKASLANAVVQEDVDAINQDLETVKEALDKLLNQQSFIQGPINIRNLAELKYVQSLGEIKNVRGNITVNVSSDAMLDSIEAVNKIISNINTIVAGDLMTTGHASGVLDFSALTFLDGELSAEAKANNFDELTAVSGNLNLDYNGDYVFPKLTSTGSITIVDHSKVLKVDFPSLLTNEDGGTFQTGTASSSHVSLAKATYVNLGGVQVRSLTTPEALTIKLGFSGTLAGTTTITAAKATEITVAATKIENGALNISGKSDGTVSLNALKEVGAGANISGGIVNADALKTVTGTLVIDGAKTLTLPALEKADGISAAAATVFSAEKAVISSTTTLTVAEEITLGSSTSTLLVITDKVKTLTLKSLANGISFDASAFSALETLNITGKTPKEADITQGSQTNQIIADNASKLKTISLDGTLGGLYLSNNTALESLTTAGSIIMVSVDNNDKLKTIKFGHTFLKGELANTIEVSNNAVLTEVDMTAVQKIKMIVIEDNAKLASIKVGSPDTLAEPSATVTFTVKGNKLPGKYTIGKAGTETTQYTAASIGQADLYALKLIVEAYKGQKSRTVTPSYDLSFDKALDKDGKETDVTLIAKLNADAAVQAGLDGEDDTDDDDSDNEAGNTSGINTARELALLEKE